MRFRGATKEIALKAVRSGPFRDPPTGRECSDIHLARMGTAGIRRTPKGCSLPPES